MPTWDDAKRRVNIAKHGLDFEGCEAIFDHPVWVYEDASQSYGEQRLCAVGWKDGGLVHMTYAERDDDFHVISLREAERHEARKYFREVSE
jgi:uncharacterized protein